MRSHSPVLDQEIEIEFIRMWMSSSVGEGGSLATFSHHGSGKWMGNGRPWTKYSGLTTPQQGFTEFCPSTVSWYDDEAGCCVF